MTALREIIILLRNTLLVVGTLALTFLLGAALSLPSWVQVIGFVPAGYVYLRLSGEPIPPVSRWLPVVILLCLVTLAFTELFPLVPVHWRTPVYVLIIVFSPLGPLSAWVSRTFGRSRPSTSESPDDPP